MDQRGASVVEYALLVALIVCVAFVAVGRVGSSVEVPVSVLGNSFERGADGQPVGADQCSGNSDANAHEDANNCHDR
jgi:Flp pilus assembly pilin Flp